MKSLPIVALIGQTNAGKSSLLNRFAHRNIAIVAREEGTTRDAVAARIDDSFLLIDTAGLKDPEDDFEATIQDQIADAVDSAEIILLTLDATKYPDDRDKQIAKTALKSRKPVLLLLNKTDRGEALPEAEFLRLGIKAERTFRTSATTGAGIRELRGAIYGILEENGSISRGRGSANGRYGGGGGRDGDDEYKNGGRGGRQGNRNAQIKLALIGRPNVGKSSLFNSLAKKQQALVSPRQGTTRDVNRVTVKYNGREIEIMDTAGLRKPGKREVGIEKFSALRSLAAIEEADVCALLVDATEPHSKMDQSLAGQIVEAGKGIIFILTKVDLVEDTDEILDKLERDFDFIPYAPVLITSSLTGKNVTKLYDLLETVDEARHTEVPTSQLNNILREAIANHPPAGLKNTHPKPKYIVQTDTCPPWFVIHGREMEMMHWSYKRYLERKIRERYPFVGTPIFFSFRNERRDD
ncbi:ribosome biogenesis GTPase Der [Candidatus Saccharibacteria bacterium]|nr:ribosome biogenesis GTPase Der [Candidatus Saccharibacteria bacterium]